MPDLDDLLTPDVSRAATDAAGSPDVAALQARGERRHRRRRAAVVGAAVVAVVAALGVTQLSGREASTPPDPAPSPSEPTSPPQTEQEAAEQVVDHPQARLTRVVVSPEDPDVRATSWRCDECGQVKSAIAVTSDGFETRHVLPQIGGSLAPAGSGFVVKNDGEWLMVRASDGSVHPVEVEPGEPRPLEEGEVLISRRLGVDPETLSAHEVPVPEMARQQVVQQPGGRIDALEFGFPARLHWSDDGGATWQVTDVGELPPGIQGGVTYRVLPSARDDIRAVVQGGEALGYDGPIGFPHEAVHRSSAGSGWTRFETPSDPGAFMGSAVVLPDGRLLAWFGNAPDGPGDPRHGFYIGEDWGSLQPVDMGAPFDDVGSFDLVVREIVTEDRVVFYAVDPSSGSSDLYATEDYGATWEHVRAR